ncbi:MAG: NUDIX domain-containing protein [Hyphomicrobiaceae bacterium]
MSRRVQTFEVSLKAFIVAEGRALFVREADTGWWELPGGRIDAGEEWSAHGDILAREIEEELGTGVSVRVGAEAVTWIRRRPTDGAFLFIVARPAQLVAGTPILSAEHQEMAWFGPEQWQTCTFPPESGYPVAIAELWQLVQRR